MCAIIIYSIASSSLRILHSLEEGFSAPQWGDETEWSHQKIISEHQWSQWSGASSSSVSFLFLWKVSHSSWTGEIISITKILMFLHVWKMIIYCKQWEMSILCTIYPEPSPNFLFHVSNGRRLSGDTDFFIFFMLSRKSLISIRLNSTGSRDFTSSIFSSLIGP